MSLFVLNDNNYYTFLCQKNLSGIFTIVPETQYVYLNHNVTFEYSTNLTGYILMNIMYIINISLVANRGP